MSHGEDYAYMTEMIHRINQDVDILRLKMITMSNYMGVNVHRDEVKELSLYVADMTEDEKKIVKSGCLINYNRSRK